MDDQGQVVDASSGHGPDFRIRYLDGRLAVGEVAWHADPVLQAMWANILRREQHQVIELGPGSGHWAVSLARGASINRLYAELPALVEAVAATGTERSVLHDGWPRGDLDALARGLGVRYLAKVTAAEPSRAVFLVESTGGVVPGDPM